MMTIAFLLEELSAKHALDCILPKIITGDVEYKLIPHQGKSDLEKSIPIKLRAWRTPNTFFVIVRDQDRGECIKIKQKLRNMCEDNNRAETLIRIIVHELESWFLGDLAAIDSAYGRHDLSRKQNTRKFKNPDAIENPSYEMEKIISSYRKVGGAQKIAPHLNINNNKSESFNQFVSGVRRFINVHSE